jgi:ABC-type Fe3+-hydroxamate transport system substrate-binding protein
MNIVKLLTIIPMLFAFELCLYAASDGYPKRIISLGSAVTENIYVLGAQDRLIANTIYCVRPEQAKTKQKIGSVVQMDIEKIVLLKPDVVIATALTKKEQVVKMEQLGINVKLFPEAKNFEQFCGSFIELGGWVGCEDKAKEIIKKLQISVGVIENKTKKTAKHSVFVQIGSKPVFAATKEYLLNDLIKFAGGINISEDAGIGFYSREKVYSQNPDVIVIVEMGVSGLQEKKIWESSKNLKAAQSGRIYVADSYRFCSPTPVTFLEALKELSGYLDF